MLESTLNLYRESYSGLRKEVWYLSIVLLINRTGAMVLPFLTVYLTTQYQFTLLDAGFIVSSFGFGSVAGSYVGGWITDRYGFYNVQLWALIIGGVLFWVVGQQESFWELSISIFTLSVVVNGFRPANQTALAYYSNPENRSRAYGLLRMAVNLGYSMGPFIGGILIVGLGYKWLFIVNGISCLLAALAFRLLLPRGRQEEKEKMIRKEKEGLSAYANFPFIIFVFFLMLGAICFMQMFSSLPIYLKDKLFYTEQDIGLLMVVNGLLIAIIEMPLIHKMGQRFKSLPIIAWGFILMGISFGALNAAGLGSIFVITYMVLLTFGEMLSMPFASTYTVAIAPEERRGEYMGLLGIGWAVAFIIAPVLSLWWAETYSFTSLFWFSASLGIISGVGIYSVYKFKEPTLTQ